MTADTLSPQMRYYTYDVITQMLNQSNYSMSIKSQKSQKNFRYSPKKVLGIELMPCQARKVTLNPRIDDFNNFTGFNGANCFIRSLPMNELIEQDESYARELAKKFIIDKLGNFPNGSTLTEIGSLKAADFLKGQESSLYNEKTISKTFYYSHLFNKNKVWGDSLIVTIK